MWTFPYKRTTKIGARRTTVQTFPNRVPKFESPTHSQDCPVRIVPGLVHQSDQSPTRWGTNAKKPSRSLTQLAKSYPNKHTRTYDGHLGAVQNPRLKGSWISDANQTFVFFLLTFRLAVMLKTNKDQNSVGSPSSEARSLISDWPFTPVQICFPQSRYMVEKWLLYELLPIIWPWAQTYIVIFQLDIRMVAPIPQTKYVQSQTDLLPSQSLFFHFTPQLLWMVPLLGQKPQLSLAPSSAEWIFCSHQLLLSITKVSKPHFPHIIPVK